MAESQKKNSDQSITFIPKTSLLLGLNDVFSYLATSKGRQLFRPGLKFEPNGKWDTVTVRGFGGVEVRGWGGKKAVVKE